ncbi:hypothetical protein B296_00026709 [Ensete ventricosum]|uniref:O-acyltransferase WSD1 C-terminal domain-containing protein n=1 Tax=Ensete ventricosum TaxID=4639 RepID=A0A426YEH0_ENSVE|nr:hypothetical protein B296_00026709 [Ensete ventricosum]
MEGRDGGTKWGNYIGYVILPFSIFESKDPMDYIRKAKEIAGRKKNSLEAIFTYKSGELIVKCFGIKVGGAAPFLQSFNSKCAFLSNNG